MLINKYVVYIVGKLLTWIDERSNKGRLTLVPLPWGTIWRRESVALHCDACFMRINEAVKVEATQPSSRRVYARDQAVKNYCEYLFAKTRLAWIHQQKIKRSPMASVSPGETVAYGRVWLVWRSPTVTFDVEELEPCVSGVERGNRYSQEPTSAQREHVSKSITWRIRPVWADSRLSSVTIWWRNVGLSEACIDIMDAANSPTTMHKQWPMIVWVSEGDGFSTIMPGD